MKQRNKGRVPDLREFGLSVSDLRIPKLDLPKPSAEAIARSDPYQMDLPEGCAEIVEVARTDALQFLDSDQNTDGNLRGVGLGIEEVDGKPTGRFALTFLAYQKRPSAKVPRGCLLPDEIAWKGRNIPVDVIEVPSEFQWSRACPQGSFRLASCSGNAIAITEDGDAEGTLGGTFPRLGGGGHRGLTNAHIAFGLSFQDFVSGLPGTIFQLFQSPSGTRIYTGVVGAPNFEIMELDTIWPILAPSIFTLPIAGALAFDYVDCAAGDVDYKQITNPAFLTPLPLPQRTIRGGIITGARIRSARAPTPGTSVYKVGMQTGTTFGRIRIAFLQIPIAIGPLIIIFDQVLASMAIANGDSGASMIAENGNRYIGSCWGGLPLSGPPIRIGRRNLLLDHTLATPAHQIFWRMNLDLF